jgi:hypothetical protein
MRRRHLLLVGLLVLTGSYLVASGIVDLPGDSPEPETLDREQLVQPTDNGSYIWPYTSRSQSTDGRTLAINLIIHGDDHRVQQALVDQSELEWEETNPEEQDAEADTAELSSEADSIEWDAARGSTRYTYFDTGPQGGEGIWVRESYQLHTGTYLGSRYHIRAYTPATDDWTGIQIHQEYWDWFSLGHSVIDIQESRNTLEADFIDQPYVDEVRREYHGVDRGRNDGWLSAIELATLLPLASLSVLGLIGITPGGTLGTVWRETWRLIGWVHANIRGFLLAIVLAGLYLGIRSTGLILEAALPWITPKVFVAVLYPVLVVGLPLAAVVLSRPLEGATRLLRLQYGVSWLGQPLKPQPAFVFTVCGLGTAFIMDFAGLGITALPIELLLHRLGLLFALGLMAAGAARSDLEGKGLLSIGLLGWIVGLAMPLVGYV